MEITTDTSVIMAVILNEPTKARLLDLTRDAELLAPPTLPWEIGNGLSALIKRGRIDVGQGKAAVRSYEQIAIRLADVDLATAVELAGEQKIYAYDAYVLECARRYRTAFLSLHGPLCSVARKLRLDVLEV